MPSTFATLTGGVETAGAGRAKGAEVSVMSPSVAHGLRADGEGRFRVTVEPGEVRVVAWGRHLTLLTVAIDAWGG